MLLSGVWLVCHVYCSNVKSDVCFILGSSEIRSDVKLIEILCLMLRAESPMSTQLAVRVAHENAYWLRAESPMSA